MRYAFYFDQSRCMSCNTCSVACKDWHGVNPGAVRWRKVNTHETDAGGFFNLSMSCNHCEKPACLDACTAGAIYKRADGIVAIDRSICQKIEDCKVMCPYDTPQFANNKQEPESIIGSFTRHPMQKCDFCADRIDKNEPPICVASCPAHALDYGDYDALKAKYKDAVPLTQADFPYAYKKEAEDKTGPSMLIKKRKSITIVE